MSPILITAAMNPKHITHFFNTKAPAECLEQLEKLKKFRESDISNAVVDSTCQCNTLFNLQISTYSSVMGEAFGEKPLRSNLSCRPHLSIVSLPTLMALVTKFIKPI
ncbi:hypothetical protein [Moellerella wisconsensis]|uniref:hypothetical protein n=1 Tax=Moellerella wisconsensis TaxID=158849 RepID=UPI003B214C11